MFMRFTVGLLGLLVLGYAARALQEYLFDSAERGKTDAVAMHTLMDGKDEQAASGPAADPASSRALVLGVSSELLQEELATGHADGVAATTEAGRATFAGQVLSEENGEPLAGVSIGHEGVLLAQSDAEGRFVVEVPEHAAFAVAVLADGYAPAYAFVDAAARDEAGEHTIELQRAAQLQGSVLDASGVLHGGVRVIVTTSAELLETSTLDNPVAQRQRIHPPDPRWEALSDARGEVRIDGLPAGVPLSLSLWDAKVENPGVHTPLVVRAASTDGIELPAGCLLSVARPLMLHQGETRAEKWQIDRVPDRVAEGATKAPAVLVPQARAPELQAKATVKTGTGTRSSAGTQPVSFHEPGPRTSSFPSAALARGPSLAGQILDDRGLPLEGLVVSARPWSSAGLVTGTSAPDGRFVISALSEGEHELVVYGGARFGTQSFGPFATGSGDLRLELDSGTILAGRAFDARDGQALQAKLSLVSCSAQAGRVATLESALDGRFSFRDLRPGSYDLVASTPDGRIALASEIVLAPAASARGIDLALRPGARLRISAHSGKLVKRAVVRCSGHGIAAIELRNGIEERLLVPAGTLGVRLMEGATVLEERSVEIAEGGEALVRFD